MRFATLLQKNAEFTANFSLISAIYFHAAMDWLMSAIGGMPCLRQDFAANAAVEYAESLYSLSARYRRR